MNFKFFLIGILLFASCNSAKSPFDSYLQRNFNLSVDSSLHFYILLPRGICQGCMPLDMHKANAELRPITTAILAYDTSFVRNFAVYLYDSSNAMYKEKIVGLRPTLIVTQNEQLVLNTQLTGLKQADSIYESLSY